MISGQFLPKLAMSNSIRGRKLTQIIHTVNDCDLRENFGILAGNFVRNRELTLRKSCKRCLFSHTKALKTTLLRARERHI